MRLLPTTSPQHRMKSCGRQTMIMLRLRETGHSVNRGAFFLTVAVREYRRCFHRSPNTLEMTRLRL